MNINNLKRSNSKSKGIKKSLGLFDKIAEIKKEIKRLEGLPYEKEVLEEQLKKDANNFAEQTNLKSQIKNLEKEIEKAPLSIEALKKQQEAYEKSLEDHLRDKEKVEKNAKNPKTSSRDK